MNTLRQSAGVRAGAVLTIVAMTILFETSCSDGTQEKAATLDAQGQQHVQRGEFEKAIAAYTQAITYAPKDGFIYFNRGAARLHARDYDGAIADFTKTIELSPKIRSHAYEARGQA